MIASADKPSVDSLACSGSNERWGARRTIIGQTHFHMGHPESCWHSRAGKIRDKSPARTVAPALAYLQPVPQAEGNNFDSLRDGLPSAQAIKELVGRARLWLEHEPFVSLPTQ